MIQSSPGMSGFRGRLAAAMRWWKFGDGTPKAVRRNDRNNMILH
jgi:hypothetical protein